MADEDNEGVIPESKIREAHAKCMQDPNLAAYFDNAPQGAKQYIALMFYCTVFQDEVDDEKCAAYQEEVEADLTKEDLLYLATNDRNLESKAHFRELYVEKVNAERTVESAPAPSAADGSKNVVRELARIHEVLTRIDSRLAANAKSWRAPAPRGLVVAALVALLVSGSLLTLITLVSLVVKFIR